MWKTVSHGRRQVRLFSNVCDDAVCARVRTSVSLTQNVIGSVSLCVCVCLFVTWHDIPSRHEQETRPGHCECGGLLSFASCCYDFALMLTDEPLTMANCASDDLKLMG